MLKKRFFKTFSLRCYVALLRMWRRRCFHGINAMILMLQIFDVTANENARYKRNELEWYFSVSHTFTIKATSDNICVISALKLEINTIYREFFCVRKFWRKWHLEGFHWVLFSLFQGLSMKTYGRVYFSLCLFFAISERSGTQPKLNPREKIPDIPCVGVLAIKLLFQIIMRLHVYRHTWYNVYHSWFYMQNLV